MVEHMVTKEQRVVARPRTLKELHDFFERATAFSGTLAGCDLSRKVNQFIRGEIGEGDMQAVINNLTKPNFQTVEEDWTDCVVREVVDLCARFNLPSNGNFVRAEPNIVVIRHNDFSAQLCRSLCRRQNTCWVVTCNSTTGDYGPHLKAAVAALVAEYCRYFAFKECRDLL